MDGATGGAIAGIIVAVIGAIFTGVLQIITLRASLQNQKDIAANTAITRHTAVVANEVKAATNGNVDRLVDQAEKTSYAKGHAKGFIDAKGALDARAVIDHTIAQDGVIADIQKAIKENTERIARHAQANLENLAGLKNDLAVLLAMKKEEREKMAGMREEIARLLPQQIQEVKVAIDVPEERHDPKKTMTPKD